MEPDEQHRVAELALVARPEALGVVHLGDVDLARPERRVRQRGVGVLAVLDRDHPAGDAVAR